MEPVARLVHCHMAVTHRLAAEKYRCTFSSRQSDDVMLAAQGDECERTGWPNNGTKDGAQQYFDWFKYQFWRFVFVQQLVAKEIQTFIEYPPMQRGASFNLDAVKAEMAKRMEQAQAASKGPSE